MTYVFLIAGVPANWTTPSDWDPSVHTIEVLGGGSWGGDGTATQTGAGGAGGGYAWRTNFAPAGTYGYVVPTVMSQGAAQNHTIFGSQAGTWPPPTNGVGVSSGTSASAMTPGVGGGNNMYPAGQGFLGGNGGAGSTTGAATGSGGGGCAGPRGAGGAGAASASGGVGGTADGGNAAGGALAAQGGISRPWGAPNRGPAGGSGGSSTAGASPANAAINGGSGGGSYRAAGSKGSSGSAGLLIITYTPYVAPPLTATQLIV